MAKKDDKKDEKKDDKKGEKKSEETGTEMVPKSGDFQDGSQIFVGAAGGGGGGSPDVQVRNAPQIIRSGVSQDDSVIVGKVPKFFKAEGRPVDAVQSAEIGDINTLGVAIQNFMPSTSEGQFFKQVVLKILQHLHGPE